MKIILSPAKKMVVDTFSIEAASLPSLMHQTEEILTYLKRKLRDELKAIWKCNDVIVQENVERIQHMNLYEHLTPAILAYDGIAFKYMAPSIFENEQFAYIQNHLRILSAFYGVLKPMDGVKPYRLEMMAKVFVNDTKNLYAYWRDLLYKEIIDESGIIINLASKEYAKCIEKYLQEKDQFITITFCEMAGNKLVTKGTYAKMARGEMVRYMAEENIEDPEDIKHFNRLGYIYRDDLSSNKEFVFERKG